MKTTLELPEEVFRQAKSKAAEQGQTLKTYFTEALLAKIGEDNRQAEKPWMKHFGALRHLGQERSLIEGTIKKEFATVNPDEWS
jgi:hypothetical protein